MRKGTYEYKHWLIRRDKKNLIRRTKRKRASKGQQWTRESHEHVTKEKHNYNAETKRYEFPAPLIFSISENPVDTIEYFNRLLSFVSDKRNRNKRVHIDISRVNKLTSDALMYLLAIVNDLKNEEKINIHFSGNEPVDANIRTIFAESGFYDFVRYQGSKLLTRNKNNIQIVSGEKCDTEVAKKISDFVCEKGGLSIRQCKFLYNIVIELMSNTNKHAYEGNEFLLPHWYCFAKYDKDEEAITFTFMDTGSGIPTTVCKRLSEKASVFNIRTDNEFVISALNGEARTATKLSYRGKGLPTIREFCSTGKIKDLYIITNKAVVTVNGLGIKGYDLSNPIRGTVFKWKIDINELKGV